MANLHIAVALIFNAEYSLSNNAVDCRVFVTQVTEIMYWLYLVNTLFFLLKFALYRMRNEPMDFHQASTVLCICISIKRFTDVI